MIWKTWTRGYHPDMFVVCSHYVRWKGNKKERKKKKFFFTRLGIVKLRTEPGSKLRASPFLQWEMCVWAKWAVHATHTHTHPFSNGLKVGELGEREKEEKILRGIFNFYTSFVILLSLKLHWLIYYQKKKIKGKVEQKKKELVAKNLYVREQAWEQGYYLQNAHYTIYLSQYYLW